MCVCVCVSAGPYVCIFVQEVEAVLIDSNNTGGVEGGGAAAVDVEERGAEHGERTDQACTKTEFNKSERSLSHFYSLGETDGQTK